MWKARKIAPSSRKRELSGPSSKGQSNKRKHRVDAVQAKRVTKVLAKLRRSKRQGQKVVHA